MKITPIELHVFKILFMHFGENSISKDVYFAVFRLLIYFPKTTIQRINNCFNLCLYKLLNLKKSVDDTIEKFNENLLNYGLFSFQHRIILKLFKFSHSIINNSNSPTDFHQVFKQDTYIKSSAGSASLLLSVIKTRYGEQKKTLKFFFFF